MKLREQQLNASDFQKVEFNADDSKYLASDGFRDSVPQVASNQQTLFPGANFSFKKKSHAVDSNPALLQPSQNETNFGNKQSQYNPQVRKKLDLDGPGIEESEVTNRISGSGLRNSGSRDQIDVKKSGDSRTKFGIKPKINYRSNVNKNQDSIISDAGSTKFRPAESIVSGEVIE